MNSKSPAIQCAIAVVLGVQSFQPALAELSCAPSGTPAHFASESDPFFPQALATWQKVTNKRPIEGTSAHPCQAVTVIGYEGFPTWHCTYSSADAGDGHFKPLSAETVLLDPSAKQLALWSIHACRINQATDKIMGACLISLTNKIILSNGAQYPIVGSVIESYCDWDRNRGPCRGPADANSEPSNTWFRDGVSVNYKTLAHWNSKIYDYNKIFDTNSSDQDIEPWYHVSRVSSATVQDWVSWRKHISKSIVPDGVRSTGFNLHDAGWGAVSRIIHKRACGNDSNELMDAIVHSRHFAR